MIDEEKIVEAAEKYFLENIPSSRIQESYLNHVRGTKRYALMLADIYSADRFIVEVAALLHDVGADAGKGHPKEGAKIAREFLTKFDIPEDTLTRIIKCIENHAMGIDVDNLEEQIIQDADGLIFLEDTFKYFGKKARDKGIPVEEEKEWVKNKTKGMMAKIKTEEGVRLAKELFPKAMEDIENGNR